MQDLAPIGVSTYSRLNHLKQTIEALKNNDLAEKSVLYIFSDAPQEGDEQAVDEVRAYADKISGFKNVHLIKREQNSRVQNNRGGMQQLLNDYGKIIFLEEDIVTSKHFLTYMNDALDRYENDEKIISVSGYCPPIRIPESYDKDVFLLKRFNAWGFGTWGPKFDPFSFSIDKENYESNIGELKPILDQYGNDVFKMIQKEVEGELDALDVKIMYHQAKNNLYTVYPITSMSKNIGHDGSGMHCGTTERFEADLAKEKLKPNILDKEHQKIVKEHRKFRNQTGRYFVNKVYFRIKKALMKI